MTGSQGNRERDVSSLLARLFTIKRHISLKAGQINDHTVYAELHTLGQLTAQDQQEPPRQVWVLPAGLGAASDSCKPGLLISLMQSTSFWPLDGDQGTLPGTGKAVGSWRVIRMEVLVLAQYF